jgi:hypothetical protein
MVTALVPQAYDWLAPSPLWDFAGGGHRKPEFFQPALVELQGATFMADWLAATRATDATAIKALVLEPDIAGVTKLFLPVHGRYYLVTASLCCRLPGFPDRSVEGGDGDSVFFVLRRVVGGKELGWVEDAGERRWVPTGGVPRRVLPGEIRQPMATSRTGGGRSLVFGYIPAASGETYRVAAVDLAGDDEVAPDLRVEELGSRFTEPLTGPADPVTGDPDPTISAINRTSAAQARTVSVYLLLDAWEFIERELPDVAAVIRGDAGAELGAPVAAKTALLDHLASVAMTGPMTLRQAFAQVAGKAGALNVDGGVEGDTALAGIGFHPGYDLKAHPIAATALVTLLDRVRDALPGEAPPIELPKLSPRADAEYVVRAVYERAACSPVQTVVSLPSQVFRIAPFFDPDAPWPPVRIPLPADVSVAGMRKFSKNVSFILSESMQKKMNSITGKEKLIIKEDDPQLSEGSGIAFICSFSIQIIFIVAFMLLLMFVVILNIAFWWMAFFKICFPIPKSLAPK